MNPLVKEARRARAQSYCPYSKYAVGAAVQDVEGRVWSGCNVENVSFGLTVCAERAAVTKMVSEGGREILAVAVVTPDGGTPCGMCLQTLLEFAPRPDTVEVLVAKPEGEIRRYLLSELIPFGFASSLEEGKTL
ncbi:MAG: cytidine deaminase [Fimbriimonadaceae bacterium]